MTAANYQVGQSIDVNCFAKNGTALLTGGNIMVTPPGGTETQASTTAQLRNYIVQTAGTYTFTCKSSTLTTCSNTDSFTVLAAVATPTPTPVTTTTTTTTTTISCNVRVRKYPPARASPRVLSS